MPMVHTGKVIGLRGKDGWYLALVGCFRISMDEGM